MTANFVGDFYGVGDGIADNATAFAALDLAVQNNPGLSCYIPAGHYRTTQPVRVRNDGTALQAGTALIGEGKGVTFIEPDFTGAWLDVGDPTGPLTCFVTISGLTVRKAVHGPNSIALRARKTRFLSLDHVAIYDAQRGMELGNPAVKDDVCDVTLIEPLMCAGVGAHIALMSGGVLRIDGGKFNGIGAPGNALLIQDNPLNNWDGVEASDFTAEQCGRLVYSTGAGISNLTVTGGISDRYLDYGIWSSPSGVNKDWTIASHIFGGSPNYPNVCGAWLTGNTQGMAFIGSKFMDLTNRAVLVNQGVTARILDNDFVSCSGPEVIRVSGNAIVSGNTIRKRATTDPSPAYGIHWDGTTNPQTRAMGPNAISGFSVAAVVGTP